MCKQEVTQAGKPNLQERKWRVLIVQWTDATHRPERSGGANMCITEDKLVESYGKANPRERFRLIYKNYSIFPQLVDCYETGLFNRILFEVEYNRRKKNDDDLGVRIQTSHRSDPQHHGRL